MSLEENYLNAILTEIDVKKKQGKAGLYKMNVKLHINTVRYLKEYFAQHTDMYRVDISKCSGCREGNVWHILIFFL